MADETKDIPEPDESESLPAEQPGADDESTESQPPTGTEGIGDALADSGQTESPVASDPTPEEILDRAEADLAAAVAPNLDEEGTSADELRNAKPFEFPSLDDTATIGKGAVGLESLDDVELDLSIELGRTELLIEEVLKLREGSVVPLDKLAGDPVDILVNGRLVARGEVLVLNDNFCVRVAEILSPEL